MRLWTISCLLVVCIETVFGVKCYDLDGSLTDCNDFSNKCVHATMGDNTVKACFSPTLLSEEYPTIDVNMVGCQQITDPAQMEICICEGDGCNLHAPVAATTTVELTATTSTLDTTIEATTTPVDSLSTVYTHPDSFPTTPSHAVDSDATPSSSVNVTAFAIIPTTSMKMMYTSTMSETTSGSSSAGNTIILTLFALSLSSCFVC